MDSFIEGLTMTMEPLTRDDLSRALPKSALSRGQDYARGGRVRKLWISHDGGEITSEVKGSDYQPYRISITLRSRGGQPVDISGDCTCPVGYNCKHVAATLLKVLDEAADGARPGAATAVAALPYEITAWLEKLTQVERGDDYPPGISQRLFYVLHPENRTLQMPHLAVTVESVRLLKDGQVSDNVGRASLHNFNADKAPKFYRDSDIAIVSQLSRGYSSVGDLKIHTFNLVRQIVATGRARWMDRSSLPLALGQERPGRVVWEQRDKSGVRPRLLVDGAVTCNAEPPVWVDGVAGLIGPVAIGLSPRTANRLLSAPAISRTMVDQVARNLEIRLPPTHHDLLPAHPAPAVDIRDNPVPVLRLGLSKPSPYNYYGSPDSVALARLTWRYGPAVIEPLEKSAKPKLSSTAAPMSSIATRAASAKPCTGWTAWAFWTSSAATITLPMSNIRTLPWLGHANGSIS
ncbi:MAG: SWIM zinc finger family protein [Asticcacaulis sp.]|nr:SWIM zinc finger family protein [Asticcacaulis sp.]